MSTKPKLTREQKALQKTYLGCVLYFKNLNGESVRSLASLYSLSVGTTSARINEGKGYVASHPEMTLGDAIELLAQVYVGNENEPKVKPQTTPQQIATHMVYALASRPQGVKSKEEYECYAKAFGYTPKGVVDITSQQKSYIRRRVREIAEKKGERVVFVPDWINVNKPQQSVHNMNKAAHELYLYMEEKVQEVIAANGLPNDAAYSLKHVLVDMAVQGVNMLSPERQGKAHADIIEALTANGVATQEDTTIDYAKEWEQGTHSVFSMPNGQCAYTTNLTAKDIHKVFEDLKDLDEAGFIY